MQNQDDLVFAHYGVALDPLTQRYAYTSNNKRNSLSVYEIAASGTLTHLSAAGQALASDGANLAHPNEIAAVLGIDATGKPVSYLYSLHSGTGKVGAFRIGRDGLDLVHGQRRDWWDAWKHQRRYRTGRPRAPRWQAPQPGLPGRNQGGPDPTRGLHCSFFSLAAASNTASRVKSLKKAKTAIPVKSSNVPVQLAR